MKKFISIALLPLILLTACNSADKVSTNTTLTCDEFIDAAILFITPETGKLINGALASVISNDMVKKIQEYCESDSPESVEDCADEQCITVFALRASDLSECEDNEKCMQMFAASHIEDCSSYNDVPLGKSLCLYSKAHLTKDYQVCNDLEYDSLDTCMSQPDFDYEECYYNRSKCIWGISDIIENVDLCAKIEAPIERDICYLSHALKKEDNSICASIVDENSKKYCEEVISGQREINLEGGALSEILD